MTRRLILIFLGFIVVSPLGAQTRNRAADSTAALAAAENFNAALAAGDSAAALALLADGVLILESGAVEDRAHYRDGHLKADIAYARAVPSQHTVSRIELVGDVAWIIATSSTTGEYNGRAINSQGAELMVLRRTPQGWKIAAVHWSSRAKRP